jgi:prolyl-tRNA synthetase
MHRWSRLFIPTLREAPADAEVASHKFLLRSGYVRQLGAGIYSYLFLGQRSINKIVAIVREEMDTIGQEFLLPGIMPSELWEQSGRWTAIGQNMFRLQDRKGAWLCLGFTHEEVMTDIARKELRSYKQLPQIWYQIQTKYRDEPRPKSGLLRVRQFLMKDSYSFDLDPAGLDKSFDLHDQVYRTIFTRCGLSFVSVEADSGAMGGTQSQEFMVYTDAGEDLIASCAHCGYAANMEKATSRLEPIEELAPTGETYKEVFTPNVHAVPEVCTLLNVAPEHLVKTMAYVGTYRSRAGSDVTVPVAVFVRGDHTVNETKLLGFLDLTELRPMTADEILRYFGAPPGFLGPIGLDNKRLPIGAYLSRRSNVHNIYPKPEGTLITVFENALLGRKNLITGANKENYHYTNVVPGRDFPLLDAEFADIRNVVEGEGCPVCAAPLKVAKAVEIGHIFKLGYKYTESLGARVLDPNGKEVTPIMGSYGIGIERILTASIEQGNDANGFWLPPAIAPFDVVVTITNVSDPKLLAAGTEIAEALESAGFDVLLDDRDERAGVKFKDADLIGVPYRVNVGKKAAERKVELVTRRTVSSEDVEIAQVAALLAEKAKRTYTGWTPPVTA